MDGLSGLRGWQWIFIIEAIPTLILAFAAYIFLPDFPENSKWWREARRAAGGWLAGQPANRAREASQTLAACLTLPASGRVRPSNILPVCVRRAPVPDRIRSRNIRPWRCGHTRSHSHRVTRTYSQVTTACGRAVGLRHPVQHMYTLIVPASRRGRGVRVTWKNTNCTTHRRFFDQSSRNIYAHLIMELLYF